jgi:hypothetical protein
LVQPGQKTGLFHYVNSVCVDRMVGGFKQKGDACLNGARLAGWVSTSIRPATPVFARGAAGTLRLASISAATAPPET